MVGIFYILLFYLIGNVIGDLTGNFIQGSVIGMVLFFAALCTKVVKADDVRGVCKFLLGNMALFFVPVGVGVMASAGVIGGHLWAIVVSALVSTVMVMGVVGWVAQWMERRRK